MKLKIVTDKISTILSGLMYWCDVIYIIRSRTSTVLICIQWIRPLL